MIPSDAPQPDDGLRGRKRRETRAKLADAALFLALRDGIEHATIDQIAERAGVSRRTFFNYFDSKEDALLVTGGFELDEDMIATHTARYGSADVIESLVGLLFIVAEPILANSAASLQRGEIIRRYPQLVSKQFALMSQMGDDVVAAAKRIVDADPRWNGFDVRDGTLQILLNLCSTALKYTTASVVAGDSTADLPQLERACVTMVRTTVERLT